MNRIDRLTAILIQLQSKSWLTAKEIADRFEISQRTVYRDIRALEASGVPIGAEAGKGYFMMDGYRLPPVMFTKEEASAILIGAKLMETQSETSMVGHFNDALLKIRAVLRQEEKGHLENLEKHIRILGTPTPKHTDFPDNFLVDIQGALVQKQVIRFDYYSNYSGEYNTREVEPIGICNYSGRWHLIAYCRLRKALRDFRLDRMAKLRLTDEKFNQDYSAVYKSYFTKFYQMENPVEVKVLFDHDVVRYTADQKYYYGFVEEIKRDDGVEMTFLVPSIEYFGRWLLMFAESAKAISPLSLVEFMQSIAQKLYQHYR